MLRPEGLHALHRQGLLHSSFHGFGSLHAHVEYNYAGKQPLPAAGLTPARNKALWAANEGTKVSALRQPCGNQPRSPGVRRTSPLRHQVKEIMPAELVLTTEAQRHRENAQGGESGNCV